MASVITDAIVADMTALAPLNAFKAEILGEVHDVNPKAIVASATRRGIEYTRKPRVSKNGGEIVTKEDLVKIIAVGLGVEAAELEGLEKATKVVLAKIAEKFPA